MNIYIIDSLKVSQGTGVRTYIDQIKNFAKTSSNSNFNLTFINIDQNGTDEANTQGIKILNICGPNDMGKEEFSNFYADQIIEKIGDVVNPLFHFNWIFHNEIAYFLKRRINCSIVFTKHYVVSKYLISSDYELFLFYHNNLGKISIPRRKDVELYHEYLHYASVDHIITVTENGNTVLQNLYAVEKNKITTIYNGIGSRTDENSIDQYGKSYFGFAEDDIIITYVGAINQRKGIFDFIPIFEKLCTRYKSLKLVIAGSGSFDTLFYSFKRYWSRVVLLGNTSQNTLAEFHKITDIGVLLSHAEQCSYAALEMMQSGIPLLVSNVDGLSEMVTENHDGLLVDLILGAEKCEIDSSKVYENMVRLIEDSEYRKMLGRNARDTVERRFLLQNMVEKTFSVYHKYEDEKYSTLIKDSISIVISLPSDTEHLNKLQILSLYSLMEQRHDEIELFFIVSKNIQKVIIELLKNCDNSKVVKHFITSNEFNSNDDSYFYALNNLYLGKYVVFYGLNGIYSNNSFQNKLSFLANRPEINLLVSNNFILNSESKVVNRNHFVDEKIFKKLLKTVFPYDFSGFVFKTSSLKELNLKGIHHLCWHRLMKANDIALHGDYDFSVFQDLRTNRESNCNEETMMLISEELSSLGIDFGDKELALHTILLLNFSSSKFILTSNSMKNWLNKLEQAVDIDIYRTMTFT